MFKKFLITCDQATTICDKSQYGEASFSEKMKLKLHILICEICRLYSAQNSTMTEIFKMKAKEVKQKKAPSCLSSVDKEVLKKKFEDLKI